LFTKPVYISLTSGWTPMTPAGTASRFLNNLASVELEAREGES